MLRITHLRLAQTGLEINHRNRIYAGDDFVDVDSLVESFKTHTAVPTRIECLTVVDSVTGPHHGLLIQRVGKTNPWSKRIFERLLWKLRPIAGFAPFFACKSETARQASSARIRPERVHV